MPGISDLKYSDLDGDAQERIMKLAIERFNALEKAANEAFVRKSRLLTAINAGGIITVLSYVGTTKAALAGHILSSLELFLIGLISNGIALFLAEKRLMTMKSSAIQANNAFVKEGSEITYGEYEENTVEAYSSDIKLENWLELLSGVAFVLGVIVIVVGFL